MGTQEAISTVDFCASANGMNDGIISRAKEYLNEAAEGPAK